MTGRTAGRAAAGLLRAFSRRTDASAIAATTVLFLAFSLGTDNFLSPFNQFNVWRAASQNVFIALGQAMVVLIGGMNLSLGAIGGLTVVVVGHSIEILGFPPAVAVVLGLLDRRSPAAWSTASSSPASSSTPSWSRSPPASSSRGW